MRKIWKAERDKKRFLPLLLLGDEQEDMIDRYLERGTLYVMEIGGEAAAVAVVTQEAPGTYELKNIAVAPGFQRNGLGRAMVEHIWADCGGKGKSLLAGTGEAPRTMAFYKNCGFVLSHRVENFFTEHYDHPIVEEGVTLRDMVYWVKR